MLIGSHAASIGTTTDDLEYASRAISAVARLLVVYVRLRMCKLRTKREKEARVYLSSNSQ